MIVALTVEMMVWICSELHQHQIKFKARRDDSGEWHITLES